MRHRFSTLLLAVVAVAAPAFARVISYAPYTNRTALAGFHERTTRYFVLIETGGNSSPDELVLYDASGREEPRVIFTATSGGALRWAALYEPPAIGAPPQAPMILAGLRSPTTQTILSVDGGASWKTVSDVNGHSVQLYLDADVGGPYVQGLSNQVRTGTPAYPFVVSYGSNGVRAIAADGTTKLLLATNALLAGQNRSGTEFLVRTQTMIERVRIDGIRKQLMPIDTQAQYSGWITPDGSAYIQMRRSEGRFLFLHHNDRVAFVLGPYDTPAPAPGSPQQGATPNRFFAVPTHDFSGAWMIQRDRGNPTTLLRHTPSGGTETMWSDPAGPEVEALIAGDSGETVLVQVHRERDVALQRIIIDPALAVWRVGDPMPREYDELYLNEQWNKGFVHVDVDRIAGGEPFVFNSGFTEWQPDIVISPPISGGGDVIQEWGVVRASLKQRLVLPGVARLQGAFDSYWLTDIFMSNPLDEAQEVEVRFIPLGHEVQATAIRTVNVTLAAREIRFVRDALHTLFGIDAGGGALHFLPAVGMNVTSRTYSRNENGGTFGFGMPAIDFFNAAGPRFPLTFSGAFPGDAFRTNALLTDTSGRGTEASLLAFGVSGPMGATHHSVSAPANGVAQFNGLSGPLGLLARDNGGLKIQPTRGTAIASVVAIDNRTNDPTYFPPDLPSGIARVIPAVGHLDGAHGARFRSDLYLLNPGTQPMTVVLEARQWDSPARKTVQFTMLPNEARVIPDVLWTLFGMTGVAQLQYDSPQWVGANGIRATSRTYTVEESGATYGSLVPPFNAFQIAGAGDTLEILGVTGEDGFRTNIGLVELTRNGPADTVAARIWILDETRKVLDTFTVNVPRGGGMQINDVFRSRGITPPRAALISVEVLTSGVVGAYATLTDNISNDTTYLGANLGAKPN